MSHSSTASPPGHPQTETTGLSRNVVVLASFVASVAILLPLHAAAPSVRAAACAPPRPHAPGSFSETISSGGLTRDYVLYVPASYSGTEGVPLVFNLHGYGSTAQNQSIYSGLPAKADEAGFIAVMPQGTGAEPHWNFSTIEPGAPDDVQFIDDLIHALAAQLCIDTARIYATGISNGAAMSVRLGCNLSERIQAIAPVAGVYFPLSCPSTGPVPVIAFHGTADPLVPYEGGTTPQGYPVGAIEDSVAAWAAHNECSVGPVETQVTANVRLLSYEGCAQDAAVQLYVVDGGGHTWPDATIDLPEATFGPTTHEISANDLMWAFFNSGAPVGGVTAAPDVDAAPEGGQAIPGLRAAIFAASVAVAVAIGGAAWLVWRRTRQM